jgi:hypothetical protein
MASLLYFPPFDIDILPRPSFRCDGFHFDELRKVKMGRRSAQVPFSLRIKVCFIHTLLKQIPGLTVLMRT